MFTSDKKTAMRHLDRIQREGLLHLTAALFLALFGAVYEHFGHGVYSFYMIYAFLIPLAPGAALYLWMAAAAKKRLEREEDRAVLTMGPDMEAAMEPDMEAEMNQVSGSSESPLICLPGNYSLRFWDYGIAVLAVGSVFRGVLEIYGTTNRLAVVYPVAGTALLCAGLVTFLAPFLTVQRMRRRYA